ncbi:hypothetical protein Nmel_015209, partial [Mimus melanotis]
TLFSAAEHPGPSWACVREVSPVPELAAITACCWDTPWHRLGSGRKLSVQSHARPSQQRKPNVPMATRSSARAARHREMAAAAAPAAPAPRQRHRQRGRTGQDSPAPAPHRAAAAPPGTAAIAAPQRGRAGRAQGGACGAHKSPRAALPGLLLRVGRGAAEPRPAGAPEPGRP